MKVDITDRTFAFALRIVTLCKDLKRDGGVPRALVAQLIRSGTSVGANVEEAQAGQSRADFVSKLSIACKEARETHYWLRLMAASDESLTEPMSAVVQEANEIVSILTAIIKPTKESANAS
jgi:four helix bundle protein